MATHSSIFVWRIPWTEEPDGLQSTGSQRVGHDWATLLTYLYCIPLETYMWNPLLLDRWAVSKFWLQNNATVNRLVIVMLYMCMLVTQSCPTLCNAVDCSPPGPLVREILQARILEWVAISFSRGSSQPKDRTQVSCTAGRFFTVWATKEAPMLYIGRYTPGIDF